MTEVKAFVATLVLIVGLAAGTSLALAHGDVTPQAVDTTGLDQLGADWRDTNPYRGNPKAIAIGTSGFNQNCARCHGLEAISGGIAPDLRYLAPGEEGDAWFEYRVRNGSVREGRVYMPKFEGVLSQEALWAIRSYLDTRRVDE
jgi:cytochrome c-550 PedF